MAAEDFTAALAEAARSINRPSSTQETLDAIVLAARDTVPGFEDVGVSLMHPDGTIETKASTGPIVLELDSIQYELGEGPCIDSMREEPMLTIERASEERRWPRYLPEARRRGLRSQMGLRLYVDDEGTLGGLNLYSTTSEGLDPVAGQVAELFAAQAAAALGQGRRTDQLNVALATRQTIGQALGILMERYRLDEERAFGFLVRLSQHTNVKLREVAEQLVADTVNRS